MTTGKSSMTPWGLNKSKKRRRDRRNSEKKSDSIAQKSDAEKSSNNEESRISLYHKIARILITITLWALLVPWEYPVFFFQPGCVIILKYKLFVLPLILMYLAVVLGIKEWSKCILLALFFPFRQAKLLKRAAVRSILKRILYIITLPIEVMIMMSASRLVAFFSYRMIKGALLVSIVALYIVAFDVATVPMIRFVSIANIIMGAVYIFIVALGYFREQEMYGKMNDIKYDADDLKDKEIRELITGLYVMKALVKMFRLSEKSMRGKLAEIGARVAYLVGMALVFSYSSVKLLIWYEPLQYNAPSGLMLGDIVKYVISSLMTSSSARVIAVGFHADFLNTVMSIMGPAILIPIIKSVYHVYRERGEAMKALTKKIQEDENKISNYVYNKEKRSVHVIVQEILDGGGSDKITEHHSRYLRKLVEYVDKV